MGKRNDKIKDFIQRSVEGDHFSVLDANGLPALADIIMNTVFETQD